MAFSHSFFFLHIFLTLDCVSVCAGSDNLCLCVHCRVSVTVRNGAVGSGADKVWH